MMSKKKQERHPPDRPTASPTKPAPAPARSATSGLPWHPVWRLLVSLAVVTHVAAIVSAPWDLLTPAALPPGYRPSTDSAGQPLPLPPQNDPVWQQPVIPRTLHRFFHDYLNLLYANHGYEFFAPDPAGTHLIRYTVTRLDGTDHSGSFPDLQQQWPRLLYHRHMMLAEQTAMMGPESGQQYADHLATLYGGVSQMEWVVHLLLLPSQVAAGTALDDPSTYQTLATVSGRPRRTDAAPAAAAEELIAIPGADR